MDDIPPTIGFPALSQFLASDEDRYLMVFKRFDRLAAQNLVYLEAELNAMQLRLENMDRGDEYYATPGNDERLRLRCLNDWASLQTAAMNGGQMQIDRLALIKGIRETMSTYREALLQQAAITSLEVPSSNTHGAIMKKIENSRHYLGDWAKSLYEKKNDLISLRSPVHEDALATFADNHCARWSCFKMQGDDDFVQYYSHDKMLVFVKILWILIAVYSIIVPLWVLYAVGRYVTPRYARWIQLTVMSVSTTVFVVILGLFINCKRSELFGASIAYLALLVVFIGWNLSSKNHSAD